MVTQRAKEAINNDSMISQFFSFFTEPVFQSLKGQSRGAKIFPTGFRNVIECSLTWTILTCTHVLLTHGANGADLTSFFARFYALGVGG